MVIIKAAAVFAAILLLVRRGVRTGHPHARFGLANYVTTVRAALVAGLAALVGEPPTVALGIGAAATTFVIAVLDGVDGPLARRTGSASRFGARFDMEVDALLVLVLSVLVWQHGKAGAWILLAGGWRYLFIALEWMSPRFQRPLPPSVRRKAICVLLVIGLGALLLPLFVPPLSTFAAAMLLALISYSFLADTMWLWQRVD